MSTNCAILGGLPYVMSVEKPIAELLTTWHLKFYKVWIMTCQ